MITKTGRKYKEKNIKIKGKTEKRKIKKKENEKGK